MSRPSWITVALWLVTAGGLAAQPPARSFVTGIVVGAYSQAPVEGAEVALLDAAGRVVGTAVSGVEGLWGLEDDALASVTDVRVRAPGYREWRSDGDVLGRGLRSELLRPGESPPRVYVPPTDDEVRDRCAVDADSTSAILAGRLIDDASGAGLPGFEAFADWGAPELPRIAVGATMQVTSFATVSEEEGWFYFCAIPTEGPVRVIGRAGALGADSVEVTLARGVVNRVEVRLDLGGGGPTPLP